MNFYAQDSGPGSMRAPPPVNHGECRDASSGGLRYEGSARAFTAVFLFLLVASGAFILFRFEPGRAPLYPVCLFHEVTGLWCPGCGMLRALHQMLHGQFVAAFRFNALFVLLLPILLWRGARALARSFAGKSENWNIRPACLWLALGALIVFGVLRNLPFASALAPH